MVTGRDISMGSPKPGMGKGRDYGKTPERKGKDRKDSTYGKGGEVYPVGEPYGKRGTEGERPVYDVSGENRRRDVGEGNYQERVMEISGRCAVQAKMIELYDPDYDTESMLKDLFPLTLTAIKETSLERIGLRSLEDFSKILCRRISMLEESRPGISSSEKARELRKILSS